jgi:hypothetical protein
VALPLQIVANEHPAIDFGQAHHRLVEASRKPAERLPLGLGNHQCLLFAPLPPGFRLNGIAGCGYGHIIKPCTRRRMTGHAGGFAQQHQKHRLAHIVGAVLVAHDPPGRPPDHGAKAADTLGQGRLTVGSGQGRHQQLIVRRHAALPARTRLLAAHFRDYSSRGLGTAHPRRVAVHGATVSGQSLETLEFSLLDSRPYVPSTTDRRSAGKCDRDFPDLLFPYSPNPGETPRR